jgi:HK97 family phage prohead protease
MSARILPEETFRREAEFIRAGIDDAGRACELSFSSELPVARGGFDEILSHAEGDCDLTRLNSGHPLLLNHDMEKQIGVVESARVDADKKGRAVVRFSKSQLAEEIWQDVKDGIRRLVSVGYRRTSEVASEMVNGREAVRFAWQPYEVSLVSVPADATVGIGRNEPLKSQETPVIEPEKVEKTMSEKIEVNEPKPDTRAKDILKMAKQLDGKIAGIRSMADDAVDKDMSVEQFRQLCLDKLPSAAPVGPKPSESFTARDISGYSITRAINGLMNGRLDGIEREAMCGLCFSHDGF